MLTTRKMTTGSFAVYWNGELTGWEIFNGSAGTNLPTNTYGFTDHKGLIVRVGPLASCKQLLASRLAGRV